MTNTSNNMVFQVRSSSYFNIVVDKFYYHINENWNRMMDLANRLEKEGPSKRWKTAEQQLAWTIAKELKYNTWNFLPYKGAGVFALTDAEFDALFLTALATARKMLTE